MREYTNRGGITAAFSAFILQATDKESQLYKTALTYANELITIMMKEDDLGEIKAMEALRFL